MRDFSTNGVKKTAKQAKIEPPRDCPRKSLGISPRNDHEPRAYPLWYRLFLRHGLSHVLKRGKKTTLVIKHGHGKSEKMILDCPIETCSYWIFPETETSRTCWFTSTKTSRCSSQPCLKLGGWQKSFGNSAWFSEAKQPGSKFGGGKPSGPSADGKIQKTLHF